MGKYERCISRGFRCIETGTVYDLHMEASRELGVNRNAIGRVLNGHQKAAVGYDGVRYTFEWVHNEEQVKLLKDHFPRFIDIIKDYK